ncbi:MAG: hypothetical protein H6Q94_1125, partial [Nitrospirae bacterium]|nr:hypothetical protein [Nitrospirota bacterium]
VMRDIGGSAKKKTLPGYFHNRDRRLRRNPVHLTPDVMIKDDVPDHQDMPVFKPPNNLLIIHDSLI